MQMPFIDRDDAGWQLAKALARYKDGKPVVLALPRGGVPVAAKVAEALHAPLDLLLVRKIGVPFQPELAMGAVVDGASPLTVRNEDVIRIARISDQEFAMARDEQLDEIERRRKMYLGNRPHPELAAHTVIVVDDGIATGATTRAALQAVRLSKPSNLVLAIPVAPTDTLKKLVGETDDLVCLEDYEEFGAIGRFYSDFRQVSDDEVKELLATHPFKEKTSFEKTVS
jgi:predicted phosphoribosyltransferase